MMPKVLMYCTRVCPYCIRAERLLTAKGVKIDKIQVDDHPEEYPKMVALTGRETVPQIFIGDHHVGGFDDLAELDIDGELDSLLKAG